MGKKTYGIIVKGKEAINIDNYEDFMLTDYYSKKMIKIHNNRIDNFNKTFIIAEIGLSHEGSLGLAKYFIDLSVKGGADAVKFQMHLPEGPRNMKNLGLNFGI